MSIPVGAARCESYSREEVYQAVKKAINAAGGLPPLNGKKVLLKPNLLAEAENGIERGVCTNPALVYAVGKIVLENGGILSIADSPGGGVPNTPAGVKKTYVGCGIDQVAKDLGVNLTYDLESWSLHVKNSVSVQTFPMISAMKDVDVIISLPKLKTHLFTRYTGAVKNSFGLVAGKIKSKYHQMFPNPSKFANMLVDLNIAVNPTYVIMDAIWGMEGEGPINGNLKYLGYILASPSVFAIDVVAQKLINLNPLEIATTNVAVNRNLISIDDISVSGDSIIPVTDFHMPSTYTNYVSDENTVWYLKYPRRCLKNCKLMASKLSKPPYPHISSNACNKCGKCIDNCSSSAITTLNGDIKLDNKKCVHCNACFVLCPEDAITMLPSHTTLTYRKLMNRYPDIKSDRCVSCGRCIRICPMDTISFVDKKAQIDLSKCIRCYCCHEMCGYDAITLKDTPLLSLYHKVRK